MFVEDFPTPQTGTKDAETTRCNTSNISTYDCPLNFQQCYCQSWVTTRCHRPRSKGQTQSSFPFRRQTIQNLHMCPDLQLTHPHPLYPRILLLLCTETYNWSTTSFKNFSFTLNNGSGTYSSFDPLVLNPIPIPSPTVERQVPSLISQYLYICIYNIYFLSPKYI